MCDMHHHSSHRVTNDHHSDSHYRFHISSLKCNVLTHLVCEMISNVVSQVQCTHILSSTLNSSECQLKICLNYTFNRFDAYQPFFYVLLPFFFFSSI